MYNRRMKPAFLNVALIGRYNSPQIAQSLTRLARFLQSHGTTVLVEAETARNIGVGEFGADDYAGIGAKADLAVVLGGDGTMLNAARSLARSGVPLVGINQGHLGFMTDIALDAMLDSMTAVLNGVYSMEERSMIDASIVRGGQTLHQGLALNDVVVNKGATGQMIQFRVHIDQQFVYDQSSDGLIIATPTG